MNALIELSKALAAIADLPEAVQKARQEQFGNVQTLEATILNLRSRLIELEERVKMLEVKNV